MVLALFRAPRPSARFRVYYSLTKDGTIINLFSFVCTCHGIIVVGEWFYFFSFGNFLILSMSEHVHAEQTFSNVMDLAVGKVVGIDEAVGEGGEVEEDIVVNEVEG